MDHPITRRNMLGMLAALPLAASACGRERTTMANELPPPTEANPAKGAVAPASSPRMPVIFAAHGAPPLLDDAGWVRELATWAGAMPRPRAVLMISAHWDARPVAIGAVETIPLVYDFYNFPRRFYELQYKAPGAPELAARVRGLLDARKVAWVDEPARGLDHGAFVPLMCMWPDADVPVLQVSLPGLEPAHALAMGRALAPLRDEGVLIFGSGFLTHNMRYLRHPGVPQWAHEFDAWSADVLARHDVDALVDFRAKGPAAATALPTWEHFSPAIVAAGAVDEAAPTVAFPITGWWMDLAFTRRSVQWG